MYYLNGNKLISSNVSIDDPSFVRITKEEYDTRLVLAIESREQGVKSYEDKESEVEVW